MDLLKEIERDISEMGIIHPSLFCFKELAEFYTLLSKLKSGAIKCGTEKNNNHFTLCAWSNQNCDCGPDTCLCTVINHLFFDLKKILINKQKSSVK